MTSECAFGSGFGTNIFGLQRQEEEEEKVMKEG